MIKIKIIRQALSLGISFVKSAGKPKIFCIGRNKTGTTSLGLALEELGIIVAKQRPSEMLIKDWAKRDFRKISRFCHTAQAFQDIPFSLPYSYQHLDFRFPRSKFILTIRKNPEQWYQSLISFHAKLFGRGKVPNYNDLKNANYVYPGWLLEANRAIYPTPDNDIYNKDILIDHYNYHNQSVLEYFRHRPNDLLILNLAEKDAFPRFCKFIGKPCTREKFPWVNQTEKIAIR
jgi:hypothetical protein